MAKGVEDIPATGSGEMRKFRQLVELQNELVEQARKNELAEQQCDSLRRELERDMLRSPRETPVTTFARRLVSLRERLVGSLRIRAQRNGERNGARKNEHP